MQLSRCLPILFVSSLTLSAADLPVREVILYKHGVGYFERAGSLTSGESARLDFKSSEMNDVLKSLTITENGGGKVSGLRYDSSIPLNEKLADFPFIIKDGQSLGAVLDQLKGARVELQFGSDKIAGAIVAARTVGADRDHPEREQIIVLLDSGDLRTLDLAAATNIRLTDPKLQLQFRDYLAALTASRSKDKRSVYIDSTDARSRDLQASYIIPMPMWKSSYRLIFADSGQPTLEGWAIVDNTTGEDWTNVRMSLVSGKPISFISALYEPRFIQRLTAELPEEEALAPTLHGGAIVDAEAAAPMAAAQNGVGSGHGAGIGGGVVGGVFARKVESQAMLAQPAPPPERANMSSTLGVTAQGQELADLFEYKIPGAVSVRKDQSVMLPFLQQKLNARKLVVYSDAAAEHPLNAAELTNTTGETLDGGPITVYDAGAYAGEALTETIKGGDKRLISYGVDLGMRITSNIDSSKETIREVHASRGLLTTHVAALETRNYTVHNVDKRAKTLIIEHPQRAEYRVLSQKPLEATGQVERFEVKVGAEATVKYPVTEERVYSNGYSLTSITPDVLFAFVQNKNLTDATRQQLQKILDLKSQIASFDSETRRNDAQIASKTQDEDRIRQNLNSLNAVSGQQQQVQDYARKLAEQDAAIAALRERQAQVQQQRAAIEAELNSFIDKMDF